MSGNTVDLKGAKVNIISLLENRRYRLYASLIMCFIVFFLTLNKYSGYVSFMLTWIAFATSNLVSSWFIIISSHPLEVKTIADKEDSSGAFIFLLIVCAAFISLVAIIFLLLSVPHQVRAHIALSFASVFCSWSLIHTLFTLRYAHLYYMGGAQTKGGRHHAALSFPDEEEPDYLDFAYFSFVLGMTFQVSDVIIRSKKIRRMALLHGFLSFVYNTVIVALSINIVSGIIAK